MFVCVMGTFGLTVLVLTGAGADGKKCDPKSILSQRTARDHPTFLGVQEREEEIEKVSSGLEIDWSTAMEANLLRQVSQ